MDLMVARDVSQFGPSNNEATFERLAGSIAERNGARSRIRAGYDGNTFPPESLRKTAIK